MSKYPKKTVYYDSADSDFFGGNESEKKPKVNYRYGKKSTAFSFFAFILHRLIAPPVAYLYTKLFLRERIIGRKKLKTAKRKGQGFVLVGNHTQPVGDAFSSNMVAFPTRTHVVVHPDNLRLPVVGRLTPYLGAIPIPNGIREARAFSEELSELLLSGRAVAIFPEAHVWPFFTGLRTFKKGALDIAVRANVPAYTFTRVYRKSRVFGFKCIVYIDGPFYPSQELSRGEAEAALSDGLFAVMAERTKESDVQVVEYKERRNEP